MYIKVASAKYKKRKYDYVRIVVSETRHNGKRVEKVIASLGTVADVRRNSDTLIKGLKALFDR